MKVYGNLINRISEHSLSPAPEIGMGATVYHFTDRSAHTVVKMTKSGKTVWLQRDTAVRTDSNGMSESQSYDFTPDPQGGVVKATKRRNGTWRTSPNSDGVRLGQRGEYYDYSF